MTKLDFYFPEKKNGYHDDYAPGYCTDQEELRLKQFMEDILKRSAITDVEADMQETTRTLVNSAGSEHLTAFDKNVLLDLEFL